MSRLGRVRRAAAGAMLAALAGVLPAVPAAAAAAAAPAPAARIGAVQASGDQLRFVFSATNLPAGSRLDPSRLRVTVAGGAVPATATVAGTDTVAGALPARAVLVLLDTSGSMAGDGISAARRAALDFARRLPADVRVGLVAFADRPRLGLAPTTDRAALAAALQRVTATGSTALYDAVGTALGALSAARLPAGAVRRLVVLSDGRDTASRATLAGALTALHRAGVPTDVVGFRLAGGDQGALRRLAVGSGGRFLAAPDATGLAAAFSVAAGTIDQRLAVTARVPTALAGLAGRRVALAARVAAGTAMLQASAEVTLPVAAGPTAAPSTAPAGGATTAPDAAGRLVPTSPGWLRWLVVGLAFAGLLAIGLLALVFGTGGDTRRRIAQLQRYRLTTPASAPAEVESPVAKAALAWTDRLVRRRGVQQAIALQLDRAGMALRVQEWLLLRACGCAALAAVLAVLTRSLPLSALVGVLVGWLGSRAYLARKAGRRCAEFAGQLPDTLQLVASSLRSGFSLPQALDAAVRDGRQPMAGELGRALAEARLGVDLTDALDTVARRMRSPDLGWTLMAMRIQREVGGNLAEVLQTTVQTMRERFQLRRHVRTLTAEGRLSAYILVALPIAVSGWMFLTRREYLRPLYTEPLGIGMLVLAVGLVLLGGFWLSRVVKVEV